MMNGNAAELDEPIAVIRPTSGWEPLRLEELWRYRELIYFLAWRDLKVRYKQTVLGVAWVVLQPLLITAVFAIVFGRLVPVSSDAIGVPYVVFAFCGLLPWQLFAYGLTNASNSVVASERLITKVYFPRLVIPLAAALSGLVDFALLSVALGGMLVYFRIAPPALWALPFFVVMAVSAALGVGLWLSALNARYRDVRHTIPFLTQLWFFLTPIVYPASFLPERWRFVYALNPMVGAIEGFRWALLGSSGAPDASLPISLAVTVALLIGGLYYFRRMERTFADVV
jgi:lipopolysaccharide transport system permease protein